MRIAELAEQWQGRTADKVFGLEQYLGGGEESAVFLTKYDSLTAAIKLLSTDDVEGQLTRWNAPSNLSHANLIRIFKTGRCEIDGIAMVYVVMELAEENLSQVLPERALTAEETRAMLVPTLNALEYIHKQGFVHAHLRPSNIMAVDDHVKLSSDRILRARTNDRGAANIYDPPERSTGVVSPAGDVWALGMTLVEVLTRQLPKDGLVPDGLAEPFGEIVRHCLKPSAAERWTVADIANRLKPGGGTVVAAPVAPVVVRKKKVAPMGLWILLALIVVVVAGVVIRYYQMEAPATTAVVIPATTAVTKTEVAKTAEAPRREEAAPAKSKTTAKAKETAKKETVAAEEKSTAPAQTQATDAGVQPMPEIPSAARNTIHGKVKVNVAVEADAAGNVTSAKLEGPGASKYFTDRTLKAVRQWKFPAVQGDGQKWRVQFEFARGGTKVSPRRVSP